MTKYELTDYLANIIFILDSQEDAGVAKSLTLGREYHRVYDELKAIIVEEEDEARRSAGEGATGS